MKSVKFLLAFSFILTVLSHSFGDIVVTNVFQMHNAYPIQKHFQNEFEKALKKGDYAQLENIASNAATAFPLDSVWHYNLACARARQGFLSGAKDSLIQACSLGFYDHKLMKEDEDLAILRRDEAFHKALEMAKENFEDHTRSRNPFNFSLEPIGSIAMVSKKNVVWNDSICGYKAFFEDPDTAPILPAIPGKTGELIRKWVEEGTAAGNVGDLYDNHDRGHSRLETHFFSGLTPTRYSADAMENGADVGASLFYSFTRPAIGNSSMANVSGPFWSSCARKLQNEFPGLLFSQYQSGTMYVYPQHEDYLPSKFGDVFPMRTPYLYISPGSSWTDKPILASMATALAALRPEVKEYLFHRGHLAPAIRYLLHASQTNVINHADYLKPEAHPVVFDGNAVDTLKLANLAHSLSTNRLFKISIRTQKDDSMNLRAGRDFPAFFTETTYGTPYAISKIWRGVPYSRTTHYEAGFFKSGSFRDDTYDRCHWIILQGDKSKISIKKLSDNGGKVEITVDYHKPNFDTPYDIKSSRVDIMCVAEKNGEYSAPSFISYYFPPNEIRTFDENNRPLSIDYSSSTNYADPVLVPKFDFKDEFIYNDKSFWIQTRRTHADGRVETITRKNY